MRSTRTYVYYFEENDLKPIRNELDRLNHDLDSRKMYMTDKAYRAGSDRLAVIGLLINLLNEPVPGPYGG